MLESEAGTWISSFPSATEGHVLLRDREPIVVADAASRENRLRQRSGCIPVAIFGIEDGVQLAAHRTAEAGKRNVWEELRFCDPDPCVSRDQFGLRLLDVGTSFQELRGDSNRNLFRMRLLLHGQPALNCSGIVAQKNA